MGASSRITSLLLGLGLIAFCNIAAGPCGSTPARGGGGYSQEDPTAKANRLGKEARKLEKKAEKLHGEAACAKWHEVQDKWEEAADAWGEVPPPAPGVYGMDQAVETANRYRLYGTMVNQRLVGCPE